MPRKYRLFNYIILYRNVFKSKHPIKYSKENDKKSSLIKLIINMN